MSEVIVWHRSNNIYNTVILKCVIRPFIDEGPDFKDNYNLSEIQK